MATEVYIVCLYTYRADTSSSVNHQAFGVKNRFS